MAKEIFNAKESQLILVVEGTYCYCQKSSHNYFQRKTFSVQKKLSTSNGKIVDVFGLHEATKNDASIMNDVLLGVENLRKVLHPGDIILLDRGFRDCLDNLKNAYNLEPKICMCRKRSKTIDNITS